MATNRHNIAFIEFSVHKMSTMYVYEIWKRHTHTSFKSALECNTTDNVMCLKFVKIANCEQNMNAFVHVLIPAHTQTHSTLSSDKLCKSKWSSSISYMDYYCHHSVITVYNGIMYVHDMALTLLIISLCRWWWPEQRRLCRYNVQQILSNLYVVVYGCFYQLCMKYAVSAYVVMCITRLCCLLVMMMILWYRPIAGHYSTMVLSSEHNSLLYLKLDEWSVFTGFTYHMDGYV